MAFVLAGAVAPAQAGPTETHPDAADLFEDLGWTAPDGTKVTWGQGSGQRIETAADMSAGQSPQRVDAPPGTSLVHSYCPPLQGSRLYVEGKGCFQIFRDENEQDPSATYYVEVFEIQARSRRNVSLVRVKGRNAQDLAHNIAWDPGADRPVGEPLDVTVGVPPVSVTFRAHPGLIHPFAGDRVFHSSWVPGTVTATQDRSPGRPPP